MPRRCQNGDITVGVGGRPEVDDVFFGWRRRLRDVERHVSLETALAASQQQNDDEDDDEQNDDGAAHRADDDGRRAARPTVAHRRRLTRRVVIASVGAGVERRAAVDVHLQRRLGALWRRAHVANGDRQTNDLVVKMTDVTVEHDVAVVGVDAEDAAAVFSCDLVL